MNVLTTPRLTLRWLVPEDDAFILKLLNEPGWLRYIGDRGIRTLDDARGYIKAPLAMIASKGFGLYCVTLRDEGTAIGLCGLLQRDTLPDPDIGFSMLSEHARKGYTAEAAAAVLRYERERHGIGRVLAITSIDNVASQNLLLGLGFVADGQVRMSNDAELLNLYAQQS